MIMMMMMLMIMMMMMMNADDDNYDEKVDDDNNDEDDDIDDDIHDEYTAPVTKELKVRPVKEIVSQPKFMVMMSDLCVIAPDYYD
jgi:hypothetical protein